MGGNQSLERERSQPDDDRVRAIRLAMLTLVGESGYAGASVEGAVDLAGHSTKLFYRHFKDKADCFAAAYTEEADALCTRVLAAGAAASDWTTGMGEALVALFDFISQRHAIARALFLEAHAAQGRPLAKREEIRARLAHAVDTARRQEACIQPSAGTAGLVVAAIESAIRARLIAAHEDDPHRLLADLLHLSVLSFFGEDAARELLEA